MGQDIHCPIPNSQLTHQPKDKMSMRKGGVALAAALLLGAAACGAGEDQDTAAAGAAGTGGMATDAYGPAVGSSDTIGTAGTMEGAVLPDTPGAGGTSGTITTGEVGVGTTTGTAGTGTTGGTPPRP